MEQNNLFSGYVKIGTCNLPTIIPVEITGNGTKRGPISVSGLIDTGSTHTIISPNIFERVSFKKTNTKATSSNVGEVDVPVESYLVTIKIVGTDDSTFQDIFEIEKSRVKLKGCDILIGRDILKYATYTYDGRNETYTLIFHNKTATY